MTTNASNEEYIKKNKTIVVDNDKNTKLHYSAANGIVDEVKAEIESGRKLDPENYLGWTPLMMAVRNNRVQITEMLLEARADATRKNKFGMSIFLISITSGNMEMVVKILNHLLCGGVSRRSLQKIFSPLSLAILFEQSHIFKYLLQQSFDINAATPRTGLTPLMFAAAMCNNKAVKRLIEQNADTSLRNYLKRTAQDIVITRNTSSIDIEVNPLRHYDQLTSAAQVTSPLILFHSPNSQFQPSQQLPHHHQLVPSTNFPHYRKSSNVPTPTYLTPNMTPITPDTSSMYHQVFFPPNFSPSQFYTTTTTPTEIQPQFPSNEFLNFTINPRYLSPFTTEMYYSHYTQ